MRARTLPLAITSVLALSACGGSALSGDGGGDGEGDDTVKIGLLVPQSGVYAPLGKDMEAGFRLFLEENDNQLGGKEVELTVVDEGAGPEDGVPAGTKLAQDESVDAVVGIVNSATALGLTDAFDEAKKPLIIANAGADDITGKDTSDYVWRTSFANGEVGSAIGEHVAEEVDGKVYLVGPDYAAGEEFLAGFTSSFEKAGGQVAGTQMTPFGKTTNFQPYLQKVRNAKPAAVFAFYAGSEAVTFVKQYDQLGMHATTPFYATGFLTEGGALTAQGKSAEGIFTSLHYSSALDNDRNAEFVKAYESANDGPPTVYSTQAYDAGQVLDGALEEGTSGDDIVAGLKETGEVDSPRGPWSFSEEQGPDQTYYLRKVAQQDGAWTNVVEDELTKPSS